MEINQIQEQLLALLPWINYKLTKPFKELLDEGISLEMYYCLQTIRYAGGVVTMSEAAHLMQLSRQQLTKMADRLVSYELAERLYDPMDRRIIKLKITDKALNYIDCFLNKNAGCYRDMLEQMSDEDRQDFKKALDILMRILPEPLGDSCEK